MSEMLNPFQAAKILADALGIDLTKEAVTEIWIAVRAGKPIEVRVHKEIWDKNTVEKIAEVMRSVEWDGKDGVVEWVKREICDDTKFP